MNPELVVRGEGMILRPWAPGDEEALVRHGDNRSIWRNLTDKFPHPYTLEQADNWIAYCQDLPEGQWPLAIEVDGEAVGGIGVERYRDLSRMTGEIGYWLGEAVWGRGLATEAVRTLSRWAFREQDFERLQATVLEWNPASARVLEKAGYVLEARLRKSIVKDGEIIDSMVYGRLRGDPDQAAPAFQRTQRPWYWASASR